MDCEGPHPMKSLLTIARNEALRAAASDPQCLDAILAEHDKRVGTDLRGYWYALCDQMNEPIRGRQADGVIPFSEICTEKFHISLRTLARWREDISTYAILRRPMSSALKIYAKSHGYEISAW